MKVLFLTEGSSQLGHGHITRCLSLYQAIEALGGKPFMIIMGDDTASGLLKEARYEVFDWLSHWEKVRERLKDFEVVVVDSYLAERRIYEDISSLPLIRLYIDDYMRLEYPPGMVLNGNLYAEDLPYPKRDGLFYLLGPKYLPLRKAFWKTGRKTYRKVLKKVLITFGGDDVRGMAPRVIEALQETYPDLELLVVIGRGFKRVEEVEKLRTQRLKLFYGLDAEGMKELMMVADLAISAGGQTTYELARVGVPSILVAVAENQLFNCKKLQERGCSFYAGWWEDKGLFDKIVEHIERLKDPKLREKMGKAGRKLIDGKGALRVAKLLKKNTSPPSYPLQLHPSIYHP